MGADGLIHRTARFIPLASRGLSRRFDLAQAVALYKAAGGGARRFGLAGESIPPPDIAFA